MVVDALSLKQANKQKLKSTRLWKRRKSNQKKIREVRSRRTSGPHPWEPQGSHGGSWKQPGWCPQGERSQGRAQKKIQRSRWSRHKTPSRPTAVPAPPTQAGPGDSVTVKITEQVSRLRRGREDTRNGGSRFAGRGKGKDRSTFLKIKGLSRSWPSCET